MTEDKTIARRIQIIVAAHKAYPMPEDPMYLPVHVGAEGKTDAGGNPLDLGYTKDNFGDNISEKNSAYCELTGLYWAWKHLDCDFIGLVHYRRHFTDGSKKKNPFESVLTYEKLAPMLDRYPVFVPKKRHYYIETLYSHYAHTHYAEQLDVTREIIAEHYWDYLAAYDRVAAQRYGYMFNMMIMRRDLTDAYCTWLFAILEELENRIDDSKLDAFQGRFYGRVSEILLNVWLDGQLEIGVLQSSDVKELPYANMEKTNWWKKGTSFLRAKFFHRRYEGSF
ncbi:DUF4422 domain-containing protein [Pseudoramibacter alactolyticus]|uniref:DUF4422 domain-containing protein n=1 Tax=Pseudoramibacter alactolyticus TaxID=113287 RepID=UPI00248E2483|nr:DUF4422 domain-containing protein [Pseudoramibacter alactolyticus]